MVNSRKIRFYTYTLIVELIPYVTGFGVLVGIGKHLQKFDMIFMDVKEIKIDIKDMKETLHSHDKRLSLLEQRSTTIESRN